MTSDRTPVSFEPFFGGFVLETLTIGMYGEARNAIREYIQNGFDSVQHAIEDLAILSPGDGLIAIELSADHNGLRIRDNGAGLRAKSAVKILTRIGASGKNHHKNAGFRGIGRLAGIVFSDTVTFRTKARGEREETTVIFDGKAMREAMTPGAASRKSATDLMNRHVKAFRSDVQDTNGHFFEVRLDGFTDAPVECLSLNAMEKFVSQVAPVPYRDDFPYRDKVLAEADGSGIPIEEVRITVSERAGEGRSVNKPYGARYDFESGSVVLSDCAVHRSDTDAWWAWVGKKAESGAYTDELVRGLRVRVRNIQIDGTALVRAIFQDHAPSYVRFQDYFLGEIFVKPSALVPNARRDGFEEDESWRRVRNELAAVVRDLGKEAYKVSAKGVYSINALKKSLNKAKKDLASFRKADFADTDGVIALSRRVTIAQKRVSKSTLGADMETAAELQAMGSGFADIKQVALSHIGKAETEQDRERVQQEARDGFLQEALTVLEDALSPSCFADAKDSLMEEFDEQ